MDKVYYSSMDTIIGHLALAKTSKGLCWVSFGQEEHQKRSLEVWLSKRLLRATLIKDDHALLSEKEELNNYFNGNIKSFQSELDIMGTPFQKITWKALQDIPYGEVRSYKEIALAIGSPKAVRAVGGANNKNPISIIIPCHRVIGANGSLVGYGGGLHIKKKLLQLEGFHISEEVS